MSGTIGSTHGWTRPVAIFARLSGLLRPLHQTAATVRAAGGVGPAVGLPLAATLTGAILWVVVSFAGAWAA